jgi:hypothetical protein
LDASLDPAIQRQKISDSVPHVSSARAMHRAVRAALGASFFTDWCARPPYSGFDRRFLGAVQRCTGWPSPSDYDGLAREVTPSGLPGDAAGEPTSLPRFVPQELEAVERCGGYEQHVARLRAVPTRAQSWHDFFNMAVWAHFPRTRWALNELHVDPRLGPVDPRNGRAPQQNVVAQLDESGIVVGSSSVELLAELRELRFKRVFWERRDELLATTRFWMIGHGSLESLLAPHLGLASKAVLLELDQPPITEQEAERQPEAETALRGAIDRRVAALVRSWRDGAPLLDPIPLLGIPGYADNARGDFYDDARYFRFARRSAQ